MAAPLATPSIQPMTRMVWDVVERDGPAPVASAALRGRRVIVLGGDVASASSIVSALGGHGAIASAIDPHLSPDAVAETIAAYGRVDAIVDLNVTAPFAMEDRDAWERPLLHSVRALQACSEPWLAEDDAERLGYLVVTRMGGHMGYGATGCVQPLGGLWAGLAKTLPQEVPNCNVRIVDLSEADYANAGEIVARELYNWGLFEIGWIDGIRHGLRARAAEPTLTLPQLSARDTVLLSGGARGIGFKLATHLARECGCRVVVTGRQAIPDEHATWAHMDAEAFRRYEHDALKRAATSNTVAAVRRRLDAEKKGRELVHNLRAARSARLPIEYRRCDVTSAADVQALVSSLASSLTLVVHNAGIDVPVRLALKSPDDVLRTVRTKVAGFMTLLDAVQHLPLRLFCNVGSLTGRWGGMTGETDYAAANEGLSRLGMWAAGRFGFPVKTICWPTWDRVGMIKNFDVTSAYMSPLDVDEGLAHWHRELRSSSDTEVTYVGNFGPALTPIQLNGFPGAPGMPNIDDLYSQRHYLGRVVSFRPFEQMRTDCEIEANAAPLLHDFSVEGRAAVPLSVLLEYAIAGADWIQPAGRTRLHVHEMSRVECWLPGLCTTDGRYAFSRQVVGSGGAREWSVHVCIAAGGRTIVRADVVYRSGSPGEGERIPMPAATIPGPDTAAALRWRGYVLRKGTWSVARDGTWTTSVRPCPPSDAWATVIVPRARLPLAHIENVIRASHMFDLPSTPQWLRIASIRCFGAGRAQAIVGDPASGTWRVVDADRRAALAIHGLHVAATAPRGAGVVHG